MATEPLTNEAIALTEKKVDMALDDIVKMSKRNTNTGKKQWRASNKTQKFNGARENALKVRQYLDSRSAIRQGAFAKRRSNFQGNQFPITSYVAQKAASAPIRGRTFNARRVPNTNKPRVGAPTVPWRAVNRGFAGKGSQQWENRDQKVNTAAAAAAPKQKRQTLDSLFANMKEQRMMRTFSQQKNNVGGNNGGGHPRVPWARGRFSN